MTSQAAPYRVRELRGPQAAYRRAVVIVATAAEADCVADRLVHLPSEFAQGHDVVAVDAMHWPQAWTRYIDAYPHAYAVLADNPAGRTLADEIFASTPWLRTGWLPPGSSLCDLVQVGGLAALGMILDRADTMTEFGYAALLAESHEEFQEFLLASRGGRSRWETWPA